MAGVLVVLACATAAGAAPLTTRPPLILHSLTVHVLGGGRVTRDPDLPLYPAGNPVQVTAVPDSGWIFAGWSGGATGTTNPLSVMMDADQDIGATFTAIVWTITAAAGSGGKISPGGLVHVNHGADQTFTITPSSGYHVVSVRVDGVSVGPVTSYTFLRVTADHTITASFAITTHTMTVNVVGTGSVTRSPNLAAYPEGSLVSLKATPGVGWLFDRWSGDTSGTANPVTLTMSVDRTVTATFRNDWTITASAGSGGTISPNGPVVVAPGGTQAFVITPDPGYRVADVKVDGVSVGAVTGYTFTDVSADHTIAATFSNREYSLTVGVVGHGRVTRDPDLARYPAGSTVTLTAIPDPGSAFAAWGGDAAGSTNPLTLTMDAAKSVTAGFDVADLLAATAATFPSYPAGLPPSWGDYDNDGDPDLPLVRNDGNGVFSEMPGIRSLLANGNYHGAAWCDYDRDGNLDLALQPYGGTAHFRLLKNQGDGTFVDVAPALGMDIAGYGATAVWGDFDGDGWVDLFAPYYSYTKPNRSYLWHNNGNGTFTDVGVESGVELSHLPAGLNPEGACAGDFDDDGDLDLYCAGHLFRNDGTGHFADVRAAMGLPLVSDGAARWVDYDDDGDLDLSLRTAAGPQLFRNDGFQFTDVTAAAGLPSVGFTWGDSWADVDNDGDLDLYLSVPNQSARLYLNQGNGTFVQDPTFNLDDSSGLSSWADDDGDGDLDLHVEGMARHRLQNTLDSRPGFAGSWLRVVVLGSGGRRTSQGATVTLRRLDGNSAQVQARVVDGGSGYLSQNQYAVHLGVDPAGTYALSVSYPSPNGNRLVVDQTQVPWLGNLVPGTLSSQTITVFKNGRANLGDWTITASAGSGGDISPSGEVPVSEGKNKIFTITPAQGYHIADVTVDGVSIGAVSTHTFVGVRADHSIHAEFAVTSFTLSVSAVGNGSVVKDPDYTVAGSASYPAGSTVTLTAVPGPGAAFMRWGGDGAGSASPLRLTMDSDKVVTAAFATANLLAESPATFPSYSAGSVPPAWGDYDNDGDMDLPLVRNNGDGTYSEIPGFRALLGDQNYHGASWCDYDRDGNLDLALLPYTGVEAAAAGTRSAGTRGPAVALGSDRALLLHNQGDGTFVDVAPALGMDISGFGETAVWADFDGDGWPDLFTPYYAYAAPYHSFLWHNNGNGTFTDIATAAGVDLADVPEELKPEGAHAVDLDGDGDLDLYCASHLFINDGTGHFTDQRAAMGLPQVFDEGAMFVDYDNDGDFDLYLRTVAGPRLFRNDGGHFTEVTAAAGFQEVPLAWGDTWVDVDNDGDMDLYLILPLYQSARLYLNQGDGTFIQDPTFNVYDSSGLGAWADVDHDGDMDLHIEAYDRHQLTNTLDQRPGFAGSWLRVVVLDAQGRRTQQGATLKLRRVDGASGQVQARAVDGGSGYLTQSEYAVHFGVDPAGTYALSVSFPSAAGNRVTVDATQAAWLGAIVPGTLPSQTIMVFRDGRVHLGEWTITASAGPGGAIAPHGAVRLGEGEDRDFTITSATGYHVADVVVDGVSVGAVTHYRFDRVDGDHTIVASFAVAYHTLAVTVAGAGHVTRDPDLAQYPEGSTVTLTAVPDPGYAFAGWGKSVGIANPLVLTMDTDKAITARFSVQGLLTVGLAKFPSYGAGLPPAWGDADNDGDPDLPLVRNDGGGAFSEMPGFRTLLANGNYHGGAWCDFDRDGDLDLVLLPYGGTTHARLLKNQGDGTFVDVAPALGMDIAGFGATAVWGDFDGDGWPDLFMPFYSYAAPNHSYLWHNNGNGTFTDVAVASGVDLSNLPDGLNPEGACAGDFDDDGDLDLYCAGHLFRNDGTGHFTDARAAMGLPLVSDGAARWVDYDDDGDLDLSLRTAAGPQLFRNDGFQFTDVTAAAGLPQVAFTWGDSWADVDNDGDLDLYLSVPNQPAQLYLNQGDGTFLMDPSFDLDDSSGLTAWADDDGDGDLDLHVEGAARHRLQNTLDSRPGFAGSWLRVVVLDATGKRSAPGATVKLQRLDGAPGPMVRTRPVAAGRVQARVVDGGSGYMSQNQYGVHLGVVPTGTYALSVSYPGPNGNRVVVDAGQVPSLGTIVPGSLTDPTITVFEDGRAHLGDWEITASAGSGGSITPSGAVPVGEGKNKTFTITPDLGDKVASVLVDGVSVGTPRSYTFVGVHADHTISASFVPGTYTLHTDVSGNGSVLRDPDLAQYPAGTPVTLTAVPGLGSAFAEWFGDVDGSANPVTLIMDADKTVTAGFTIASLPIFAATATTFPSYPGGLPPAWGDADNDGDPDLPLVRNDGDGAFSEMPGFRTLLANGNYHGGAWCDFDRDGDLDLALQPYGGGTHARLLKNQGDGTFVDVAPSLGMDLMGYGATAVWGDFDGDGWPDLFAPYYSYAAPNRSYLWHNNGNGTFTDVAVASGVDLRDLPDGLNPEGACAGDFDDDGDLDLYCAGHLFRNDGTGHFTDVRAAMGLPLVSDGAARWVDYDDDGDLDLSLRTAAGPQLFRNDGSQFTDVTAAAGLPQVAFTWGDSWADVDNDGDLDLYLSVPNQSARLYLNQGNGTFVQDPTFNLDDSSGLTAWADDDDDGDLDLHVEGMARHRLQNTMESRAGFAGSWLRVVVLDATGRRTALGATVKLRRVDGVLGGMTARRAVGSPGTELEFAL